MEISYNIKRHVMFVLLSEKIIGECLYLHALDFQPWLFKNFPSCAVFYLFPEFEVPSRETPRPFAVRILPLPHQDLPVLYHYHSNPNIWPFFHINPHMSSETLVLYPSFVFSKANL